MAKRRILLELNNNSISYLDTNINQMKRHGWLRASRSKIVDSVIEALIEKKMDFKGISSKEEITNRIISNL